jgi:hypothetical protein
LRLYGYSENVCIDLCHRIEELNDGEEARIICDEKSLNYFFIKNNQFGIKQFKIRRLNKMGIHDVFVNEKMLDRYRKYFHMNIDHPIILVCASEYGIVGIIEI